MAGARPKPVLQPGHETVPSAAANATVAGAYIANEAATAAVANAAPTVANALIDQNATEAVPFSYAFAANSFSDGGIIGYRAELAGGGPLPAWLTFTSATRTFAGTPDTADVGVISVRVSAVDTLGQTISDIFTITVAGA